MKLTLDSWEWRWYPGSAVKHAIYPMSGVVTECGLPGWTKGLDFATFIPEHLEPTLRPCGNCLRLIMPEIQASQQEGPR